MAAGSAAAWSLLASRAHAAQDFHAGEIRRLKIGQIGTAHPHAAGKMAALRKLKKHFQVVGVAEPDPERRRCASQKPPYEGVPWMTERELLQDPALDAVAVETAEDELVPAGMRCICAGKHIHMDKPAGRSLGEFKTLLDGAASRGLTVQMGYMFRSNPAFELCFEAVRKGWLGEIFEVHGVISKAVDASRRKRLSGYSGGAMFLLGCHLIDACVAVLGAPEKVASYARRTRPAADNLVDNQLAVLEYPKAVATIRSSLLEVEGFQRRQFVVCGDRGTVEIKPLEPPKLSIALSEPVEGFAKGCREVKLPAMPGRYDRQLVEFARLVRGEIQTCFTPAHDLAAHEAVLRASGLL